MSAENQGNRATRHIQFSGKHLFVFEVNPRIAPARWFEVALSGLAPPGRCRDIATMADKDAMGRRSGSGVAIGHEL